MKIVYGSFDNPVGLVGVDWEHVVYVAWDGGASLFLVFQGGGTPLSISLPKWKPAQFVALVKAWLELKKGT